MTQSLDFGKSGQTLVVVHSAETPTDAEWDAWVERMAQRDYKNILISSLGGGPNARQRRKTNKFWQNTQIPRFALVTTSRFVLAVVKAFNWFLDDQLKPFPPSQMREALDYIEVPESERDALILATDTLRARLVASAA